MKCPVCKTACHVYTPCPECGFDGLKNMFLSKEDGELWLQEAVLAYRSKYWANLKDFDIDDGVVLRYKGQDENVYIPYGIYGIEDLAFREVKYIRNVFFPDTLRYIGANAFLESSVEHVQFKRGLERIGYEAFADTNLKGVTIPDTCKEIQEGAFRSCHSMQYAILCPGVQRIEEDAFSYCFDLRILVLPSTVCMIAENSFAGVGDKIEDVFFDYSNPHYTYIDQCIVDKNTGCIIVGFQLKQIPTTKLIKRIGSGAFEGYSNLECDGTLIIPDNICEIGSYAFAYNESLSFIKLSKELHTIDENAFVDMENCTFFCDFSKQHRTSKSLWYKNLGKSCMVRWAGEWNFCDWVQISAKAKNIELPF